MRTEDQIIDEVFTREGDTYGVRTRFEEGLESRAVSFSLLEVP